MLDTSSPPPPTPPPPQPSSYIYISIPFISILLGSPNSEDKASSCPCWDKVIKGRLGEKTAGTCQDPAVSLSEMKAILQETTKEGQITVPVPSPLRERALCPEGDFTSTQDEAH